MKPIYFALSLFGSLWLIPFVTFSQQELVHWESRANEVEIIRDDFGVPHIYGTTDADAVFGLLYAQC